MNKKLSFIMAAAIAACALSGCNSDTAEEKQNRALQYEKCGFSKPEVDRVVYQSLGEVEEKAELIITARVVEEDALATKPCMYDPEAEAPVIVSIYSYCAVEITQVLKGSVKVGDKIIVGQSCGVYENSFYTVSDLTPLQIGDEWIFCLAPNDEGIYWCVGDSCGRFPLPEKTNYKALPFDAEEQLGVYEMSSYRSEIHKQILEKYFG